MKNRIIAIVLAAVSVLCFSSCSSKVIMTVGGEEVEYQEYRYYLLNNKRDSFDGVKDFSEDQISELKSLVEENAKRTKAIDAMAKKYNAVLSKEDIAQVEAYIAAYIAEECYNDKATYRAALESYYMTEDIFRDLQQDTTLAYRTMENMVSSGAIKTDDASIDALFKSDELLCIKEIYFDYPNEETKDFVSNRAKEALERIDSGEDFSAIMREYSSYNPASMPPEYGYYTTEYEMPEYIWNTAISLNEGEYSDIIESAYGYHIVMRCEKDTAYMEEIREDIVERYISAMYTRELYAVMNLLVVEYTDYGKKLDILEIS